MFSYTRRPFLGVHKISISIRFWVFREMNIFWGYEDFVVILGLYHIIGLYLRVISIHFRAFLKVNVQYWNMCLGLLNFKYFWVCLIFLIFLGKKSRCWVQAYVFRKNESIPSGVRHTYHLSYQII